MPTMGLRGSHAIDIVSGLTCGYVIGWFHSSFHFMQPITKSILHVVPCLLQSIMETSIDKADHLMS